MVYGSVVDNLAVSKIKVQVHEFDSRQYFFYSGFRSGKSENVGTVSMSAELASEGLGGLIFFCINTYTVLIAM